MCCVLLNTLLTYGCLTPVFRLFVNNPYHCVYTRLAVWLLAVCRVNRVRVRVRDLGLASQSSRVYIPRMAIHMVTGEAGVCIASAIIKWYRFRFQLHSTTFTVVRAIFQNWTVFPAWRNLQNKKAPYIGYSCIYTRDVASLSVVKWRNFIHQCMVAKLKIQ